jgi:hypothetical protein
MRRDKIGCSLSDLTSSERHLIDEKFDLELSHSGIKGSAWVWHFCG